MEKVYDYIVIGSGFGGSVSAMRLSEKGYKVLVIEKGKKYEAKDFPKTNWNVRKFLWAPIIKCFGFQALSFFKHVFILSGVGVGGGSLVYANTHMMPKDKFFTNPSWSHFKDWKTVLAPYYEKAKFMLGTTPNPALYPEDEILKEIAEDMGQGDSFDEVEVGVYFGDKDTPTDPYFNGLGPKRTGCVACAGCMVGCRHGAKNTLDKNYLHFAQEFGTEILAETLASKIEHKDGEYHIHTEKSTAWFRKKKQVFKGKGLVVAGGVMGTMKILLQQKKEFKTLKKLSDKLGFNLRTNSESICGVTGIKQKMNHGVAITSTFDPDDNTRIEVVKYPSGSDVMGKLATLSAGKGTGIVRTAKLVGTMINHPTHLFKTLFNFNWANNTVILLVMQTLDSSMKMVWKQRPWGGGLSIDDTDARAPSYIDVGQDVMHRYAEKTNGIAQNAIPEVVFNMSTTAHILGGCPMGATAEEGVVNENFEVHNYPNMYILDGSIIPANLGVNPSLTITCLSEYAMDQIPEKANNKQKKLTDLIAETDKK